MAWDSGTITDNQPSGALSDKLKALVGGSGVANWSFVENVPAGTGTGQSGSAAYSVDVFKCSGSGTDANKAGIDFYVALARYVANPHTSFNILVCEDYSPVGAGSNKGMFRRPGGYARATIWVPDPTLFTYDETWRTFNAYLTAGTSGAFGLATLNNSGFTYAIKLHKDFVMLSVLVGTTNTGWAAWLLDSATSVSDPMPLVFSSLSGSGALSCGSSSADIQHAQTRLPGVTASDITSSGLQGVSGNNVWLAETAAWTTNWALGGNTANANDKWQGGKCHATRLAFFHKTYLPTTATWPKWVGWFRGLAPQEVLAIYRSGTIGLGDTTTIGANSDWTVIAPVFVHAPSGQPVCLITRAV